MGFYSITSIRASVNALTEIGKPVKVIDEYDNKGCAIEFPHVHSSTVAGLDPIAVGTTEVWRKALSEMEYQRKMIGPCLCGSSPITIDDVRCFRDEWHELIAEIQSINVKPSPPVQIPQTPVLQCYLCSRALLDGEYSHLRGDIAETHGQWYVSKLPDDPEFTGDWLVMSLTANRGSFDGPVGMPSQSIVIRSTSAQAAAEKAETILTAISLCF